MSAATEKHVKSNLFKDVKYYVTGTIEPEIQKLLENGGASSTKIMFTNITHLLCGAGFDEKEIGEANDIYDIPSVTGEWVEACVRLGRLVCPKIYHPIPNGLFTPIVAAFTELGINDRKRLYGLITFHGGRVERYFTPKTTHLVCGRANGDVYTKAMELKSDKFCIVSPDWFYECLNEQKLIDPKPYHPRRLKPAIQNVKHDNRSLAEIMGTEDEEKKPERTITKSVRELFAKQMDTTLQMTTKSIANSTTSATNSITTSSTPLPPIIAEETRSKPSETHQSKPIDNLQTAQRNTMNQSMPNQPNKMEQSIREKMEQQQHQQQQQQQQQLQQQQQTMIQVTKPITPSTPTTPVHSQLLQKQLELPLKMDNSNVPMQSTQQSHPQIQQFQVAQPQKSLQNQQQLPIMQTQQMMGQVKIDQSNQLMNQKQAMTSMPLQGLQNVQPHVQNIATQQQNQIQIQPIQQQQPQQSQSQQQQQHQANQMQQIVDQSGQIQFMNAGPPGTPTNFNSVHQNQQQMKVIHNVQQPQMQQQTQQFIVQSPGPNKTMLNQNVVFINQSGQQQIITSNQQQGNNVALIQQQQRNMNASQQPMQIQGQQIVIHSSVQQPPQNQILQSPQQQTQFIVQTSPSQGTSMMNQSPNQRMVKTPTGAPASWYLQQQQQQQTQQQQQAMGQNADVTQNVSSQQMQNMQQKLIQQSPGANQQMAFPNMQNTEHPEGVMAQQHNQTIMITASQAQGQQPSQTPPIQQVQGMMQNQGLMQKMHVQNQQIVLTPSQSPQHGNMQMQMQSLSPQQQKPPQQGQQVPGQPQFIRAARAQWPGNQRSLQRQLIHLDAHQHAHLQTLEPVQRAEYLAKLQKRNILLQQQQQQQQQQGFIQGNAVGGQLRPQLPGVIARPQMPGTPMQWIQQQQQQRPMLVRSAAPGLSPISQQTIASPGGNIAAQQSPVPQQYHDPNTPPQFQRMQAQQAPGQKPMPQGNMVVPIQKPFAETADQQQQQQQQPNQGIVQQQPGVDGTTTQVQMNKTKTALAHMLNSRLSNTGNNGAGMPMQATDAQSIADHSAAGTLRMMTAQLNSPVPQQPFQVDPNAPTPQFKCIQIQQTPPGQKPMPQGNMIVTAQKPFPDGNVDPQQPPIQVPGMVQQPSPVDGTPPQIPLNKSKQVILQSPSGMKSPPFSPNRSLPRPQFYGHNPNLKLPAEMFLTGCIFYIVEYDESNPSDIPEWKKLIQRHGGDVETVYCPRVTHVLCRTQRHGVVMQALRDSKRCVTAYWLNDTILRTQVQPPSEALHLPMPSTFGTQRPATKHIISVSGFDGDERSRVKQMVEESGALLTPYFSRHNSVLICKKPEGNKYKRAKDWNIPVVNCVWLNDILQGNLSHMSQYEQQKYQQYSLNEPLRIDYSLVAHLMNAWKSPINLTTELFERVKRLQDEPASNEPKPKKIRKYEPLEILPDEIVCNEKPEQVPKIVFSQVDNLDGLKNAVTTLGGEIVEPDKATHLVLTHLVRTYKLMLALCSVDHIVSSKWIVDSAKAGKFLRPDEYTLNDDQFRKLYKCDIQEVIKSTTRKTLFSGKTFFITPSVRPKHKDVVKLIEFCDGNVETKRRTAVQISQTNNQQPDSYIILTCTQDLHLVLDLMKVGKSNRFICSTELVLAAIMHQKVEFEPHIITYDRQKLDKALN